jgi:flagellar hook assembly protein FlgD
MKNVYVERRGASHFVTLNPTVEIIFALQESQLVMLVVFNLSGQRIRTLANRDFTAGYYSALWDGKDSNGNAVPAGIYVYQIKAGEFVSTKKMIAVK